MNHRGAPNTKITTPKLNHGASSQDVRDTMNFVRSKHPEADMYAMGFSLGANILTKYLGEEGEKCYLKGISCVSNPWNFLILATEIEKELFGFYNYFISDKFVKRHLSHDYAFDQIVSLQEIKRHAKTFAQFDMMFTLRVYGYSTLE